MPEPSFQDAKWMGSRGAIFIKQPLKGFFTAQPLEGAFVDVSRYSNLPRDPVFDLVVLNRKFP